MGVPEIVVAVGRHARVVDDAAERIVDRVGMYRLAVAVGEHLLVVVGDPDCGEPGGLVDSPAGEDGEGGVVEGDGPSCGLGFAARLADFVADGDESAVEVQAFVE